MEINGLKNKKVVLMGLGAHGGGLNAAKFLAEKGAKLLVTDLKPAEELQTSLRLLKKFPRIKYILGRHRLEDFRKADLIIKNPAIPFSSPFLREAKKNKIPIESDVSLFFRWCPAEIIGITGSKGKSTTAALCAEFLKQKFKKVFLAGNIRKSVLAVLPAIDKESKVVLELSSWQLRDMAHLKKSPRIALITNIMPDHLNYYKTMKNYVADKEIIFKFQNENDYLFLNRRDKYAGAMAKKAVSRIVYFNDKPETAIYRSPRPFFTETNKDSLAGAAAIAEFYGLERKQIQRALNKFSGLEGRMEFAGKKRGINFFNNTCATIPEATINAMKCLPAGKTILIAGGADKKLDFAELAGYAAKNSKAIVLLQGSATEKITECLKKIKRVPPVAIAGSMVEAVKKALSFASAGDNILLSPACASFGMFRHEFDRGSQFKHLAAKIK